MSWLIYASHSILEEDSLGFKPGAVYVTLRQITGNSSHSRALRLPSPCVFPVALSSLLLCEKPWSLQNDSPTDCSASLCLEFLSSLATLSLCLSLSVTHSSQDTRSSPVSLWR